jgi:hypothetical protein
MAKNKAAQYKVLLQLINEEIDFCLGDILTEQGMPPATPPETPPSTPPEAPGGASNGSEEEKDEPESGEDLAKSLVGETDRIIRQKLLRYSQEGDKRKTVADFLVFFNQNTNDETKIPPNLKRVVNDLIKGGFKLPQKSVEEIGTPTPQGGQIAESVLQKTLREYLHYRNLYMKSGGK